jgi:hypothetical protein
VHEGGDGGRVRLRPPLRLLARLGREALRLGQRRLARLQVGRERRSKSLQGGEGAGDGGDDGVPASPARSAAFSWRSDAASAASIANQRSVCARRRSTIRPSSGAAGSAAGGAGGARRAPLPGRLGRGSPNGRQENDARRAGIAAAAGALTGASSAEAREVASTSHWCQSESKS